MPSPDGRLLVTWESDGDNPASVRIWDLPSIQHLGSIKGADLAEKHAKIRSVQFSRDGLLLMVAFESSTIAFLHAADQRQLGKIVTQSPLLGATLSPDGHHVLTRHEDHLRVWEITTGCMLWELDNRGNSIEHASYSPSGEYILIASDAGVIRLLDPVIGARLATFRHYAERGLWVRHSRDGSRLLLEGNDCYSLWEAQGTLRQISSGKLPIYNRVRTDLFCSKVACWRVDTLDKVVLYDADTWSVHLELEGFDRRFLKDLSFSPDGTRLAVAADGIYIFETETGKLLSRIDRSCDKLHFIANGQQLLARLDPESPDLYVIDVGAEQRTASSLAELLRTRVPYRLNGATIAQAELAAPRAHAQSAPKPKLLYSDRRDALWRAVYASSNGRTTEAQAWLVESKTILARFCDAEGMAMQEFAELAVRRRIGQAVVAEQTFRATLSMLGRDLPDAWRRAEALKSAGALALRHLDEPLLAIYAYQEYLKVGEDRGDVRNALLTAQLCAGHYEAVISAADAAEQEGSDFSKYSAMLGWLAAVMQRGSVVADRWSIRSSSIIANQSWRQDDHREHGATIRRAVFKAGLPIGVTAQVVYLWDLMCCINLPETARDGCLAVLDGRESVLKRIEARDTSGLLVDAEGCWPHISKLRGGGDLWYAAVFWSLALTVGDAEQCKVWASRIYEQYSDSYPGGISFSRIRQALAEQNVAPQNLSTISGVFRILLREKSTQRRKALDNLLNETLAGKQLTGAPHEAAVSTPAPEVEKKRRRRSEG